MALFERRDDGLAHIEDLLADMLVDCVATLGLARDVLFEDADPHEVGPRLWATDKRVNQVERDVRRAVLVHIAVAGPADSPALLTYMSVVKDVERLGDYAKNLYDLVEIGADFATAPDHDALRAHFEQALGLVPEAATAFSRRDTDQARTLVTRGERLLTLCDEQVADWARSDRPAPVAVPRALLYRYLKRIVAHTANLLSAVVMPVDLLDYLDEDHRHWDDGPADGLPEGAPSASSPADTAGPGGGERPDSPDAEVTPDSQEPTA